MNASTFPDRSVANTLPLDTERSKVLIQTVMMDQSIKIKHGEYVSHSAMPNPEELKLPFLSQIVLQRIEVMDLPVKFSTAALLSVHAFCALPGSAVLLLIDCLNHYEGQLVTVDKLCELYPNGFYRQSVLEDIIDNYLKPRKHPWSQIY